MTTGPRYGWYGDDFTGASDTLATLTRAGLKALMFLGVPKPEHLARAGELDAVGIAGATRAMRPDEMAAELEPAGAFFAALGVRLLHYKVCSTFDSAPHVGNVAVAARTLGRHVPHPLLPIIGGQPSIGRYCAFSTLFAAAGTGGNVFRIDRHPTMARHPVTPMGEADLRLHLAAQGMTEIQGVHLPAYATGTAGLEARLAELGDAGAVLFDVTEANHLPLLGEMLWRRAQARPLLAIGASSVAEAVAGHWQGGAPLGAPPRLKPADGPLLVVAGSLSPVTARQVATATSFARMPLNGARLAADPAYGEERAVTLADLLSAGRSVLAWTAPDDAAAADTALSGTLAGRTAALLARVLERCPVRRVAVAGGDTSSRAMQALGLWGLTYVTAPDPGVALCRAHADDARRDGMELLLKGGQMGAPDLFERLLHGA